MKKERKRKNALPRMAGKQVRKGSGKGSERTARHPDFKANRADKEFNRLTRSGVGP